LVLVLACLSVAAAVKLDETAVPYDEWEAARPVEEPEDPAQVLEELEEAIFDEVVQREEKKTAEEEETEQGVEPLPRPFHERPPVSRSPKKCCKLGRQVAANGLFCSADLMQVEKRPNTVHRRKMKFHGAEVHGKTSYKDLMRRVEKCSLAGASRSMFVKCCQWQELIRREMDNCRALATQEERRECRRMVQSRE